MAALMDRGIVWIDSYPPPIPAILAINLDERTDRYGSESCLKTSRER